MKSWVRYSIAAYVGLMLAGILMSPQPTEDTRFALNQPRVQLPPLWKQPIHPRSKQPTTQEETPTPRRLQNKADLINMVEQPA